MQHSQNQLVFPTLYLDILALPLAAGLDLLGEPPTPWHPVVWYGKLIRCLEQSAPSGRVAQLFYGAGMLVLATLLVLPLTLSLQVLARRLYRVSTRRHSSLILFNAIYTIFIAGLLKPFFALRMLVTSGCAVRRCLENDDLPAARQALRSLVSRDRSQLTPELVAAAAVESLAENLSDSVVAPLFFYTLFGLPGAALYRLYNTFDSMIGYRGHYEYLGKAAARLDDLLNLIPSRLTACLIILAAPLYKGNCRRGWYIWHRDAHKTASPNAGHPMSAAAGALGIQLEKVDHYILGDPIKPLNSSAIKQAEHMVWWVGAFTILLAVVGRLVWSARHVR